MKDRKETRRWKKERKENEPESGPEGVGADICLGCGWVGRGVDEGEETEELYKSVYNNTTILEAHSRLPSKTSRTCHGRLKVLVPFWARPVVTSHTAGTQVKLSAGSATVSHHTPALAVVVLGREGRRRDCRLRGCGQPPGTQQGQRKPTLGSEWSRDLIALDLEGAASEWPVKRSTLKPPCQLSTPVGRPVVHPNAGAVGRAPILPVRQSLGATPVSNMESIVKTWRV